MSLSATSPHLLNPHGDGDSTAALGSLYQGLTSLWVKKSFLISNRTPVVLPWLLSVSKGSSSSRSILPAHFFAMTWRNGTLVKGFEGDGMRRIRMGFQSCSPYGRCGLTLSCAQWWFGTHWHPNCVPWGRCPAYSFLH